jgi:hypothetical protein
MFAQQPPLSPSAARTAPSRFFGPTFAYDLQPERALPGHGFDVSAAGTVPRALSCALAADNWEGAVRAAVCLGGDTDTLACIAGAVSEAMYGLPPEIAATARNYLTQDLRAVVERFEAARDQGCMGIGACCGGMA